MTIFDPNDPGDLQATPRQNYAKQFLINKRDELLQEKAAKEQKLLALQNDLDELNLKLRDFQRLLAL